jgi:uncharacterized DUF497 family protein
MRFVWDEEKLRSNLRDHEIDFVDAERVFAGLTSTFEDDRFSYDEQRFVTLGFWTGCRSQSYTPNPMMKSA